MISNILFVILAVFDLSYRRYLACKVNCNMKFSGVANIERVDPRHAQLQNLFYRYRFNARAHFYNRSISNALTTTTYELPIKLLTYKRPRFHVREAYFVGPFGRFDTTVNSSHLLISRYAAENT